MVGLCASPAGDPDMSVGIKSFLDVIMTGVGFCGPKGFHEEKTVYGAVSKDVAITELDRLDTK